MKILSNDDENNGAQLSTVDNGIAINFEYLRAGDAFLAVIDHSSKMSAPQFLANGKEQGLFRAGRFIALSAARKIAALPLIALILAAAYLVMGPQLNASAELSIADIAVFVAIPIGIVFLLDKFLGDRIGWSIVSAMYGPSTKSISTTLRRSSSNVLQRQHHNT
ncbi:MAG: hypothetical protein KIS96_08480 [Bauldia sp.]|nr:hypothetical protein [Bauldia sp.]